MLGQIEARGYLVVWKLDRLGRSLPHLVTVLADLQKQGGAFLLTSVGFLKFKVWQDMGLQ